MADEQHITGARERKNVLMGMPDITVGGGLVVGKVLDDKEKYPKDATSPLHQDFGFNAVGYIGKDGVSISTDESWEKIEVWDGSTLDKFKDNEEVTFKFMAYESANLAVLKALYGEENVTGTQADGISVANTGADRPEQAWVMQLKAGRGRTMRVFIPIGKITGVGEIKFAKSGVVSYELTVTALLDKQGATFYQFISGTGATTVTSTEPTGTA